MISEKYVFKAARPVWASGREKEMNCELAFRTSVKGKADAVLHLAASTIYRVWINGAFACAGPARAAHGYYRVDSVDLGPFLGDGENALVIEVVGFNVNSYDTLDQPAFLTAEVIDEESGKVMAATGAALAAESLPAETGAASGELVRSFRCFELKKRVQKVQRYSFQRAFAECYRLKAEDEAFYRSGATRQVGQTEANGGAAGERLAAVPVFSEVPLVLQPEKNYISRGVPMPQYEILKAEKLVGLGCAVFGAAENPQRDRSVVRIGPRLKGYRLEELEFCLSDEAQGMHWQPEEIPDSPGMEAVRISAEQRPAENPLFPQKLTDGYATYAFPYNATGFIQATVRCDTSCVVYFLFDEILTDGDVDPLRLTGCNCFRYELEAGTHHIMTFAAYTMKYLKIACKGGCTLLDGGITEYQHPAKLRRIEIQGDPALQKIADAAVRTFRQNALDIFMDCPSRERSGWLCDSFFTSRVEKLLTGGSDIEKAFLTNFLLPDHFEHLPKGMLPMCYPADHYDGNFIPNWAMWFVLELEEYVSRSGDRELLGEAKDKIYGLLQYFEPFENEFGLLEKLEQWVFVEWSRANDKDVVQDVNFPTNMLYAKMLETVGRLYDDSALTKKSEKIKDAIRSRSFNGTFFTDNERRTLPGLENPGNMTEVCQYYAFFTGVADKENYPDLWKTLLEDFGPQRKITGLHPEVAFANAFIGNYLRIELLHKAGLRKEVLDNIKGYFEIMADATGTLWEHDKPSASCNHGFASHVLCWLAEPEAGTEPTAE